MVSWTNEFLLLHVRSIYIPKLRYPVFYNWCRKSRPHNEPLDLRCTCSLDLRCSCSCSLDLRCFCSRSLKIEPLMSKQALHEQLDVCPLLLKPADPPAQGDSSEKSMSSDTPIALALTLVPPLYPRPRIHRCHHHPRPYPHSCPRARRGFVRSSTSSASSLSSSPVEAWHICETPNLKPQDRRLCA